MNNATRTSSIARTAQDVRTSAGFSIEPGGATVNACVHDRIHRISLLIGLIALLILVAM